MARETSSHADWQESSRNADVAQDLHICEGNNIMSLSGMPCHKTKVAKCMIGSLSVVSWLPQTCRWGKRWQASAQTGREPLVAGYARLMLDCISGVLVPKFPTAVALDRLDRDLFGGACTVGTALHGPAVGT